MEVGGSSLKVFPTSDRGRSCRQQNCYETLALGFPALATIWPQFSKAFHVARGERGEGGLDPDLRPILIAFRPRRGHFVTMGLGADLAPGFGRQNKSLLSYSKK